MNMKPIIKMMGIIGFSLTLSLANNISYGAENEDFQRFGGKAGLTKIVDDFMVNVLADARIKKDFENTNIPHLKKMLVEQFCSLTGGDCTYTGRDMKSAHQGLNINQAKFNALAEDLQMAMEAANIPNAVQNRLVAKLAPMQRDVVTK